MKIKELLSDESKWCKHYYGMDAEGNGVGATNPQAVCWCLSGAIAVCYPENRGEIHAKIESKIEKDFNVALGVVTFNDSSDFETVKKLVEELDI